MVNYSYCLERIIAMKYLTLFSDKLISFKKEAAVPAKGPTVFFFSTKLDVERKWAGRLTISESVVRSLSLPKNGKFFSNLVIPTAWGRGIWREQTIRKILSNEKYIGDSLCRKSYTTDTFPYVRRMNKGNVDQYYTENSHPAIIDREAFEKAQILMRRRGRRASSQPKEYPLSKKIICGECGSIFTRKVSRSGYTVWVCRRHDRRSSDCSVGRIAEYKFYAAFVRMYNKLKLHEGIILKPALGQLKDLNDALQQGNPAMLAVNRAIAEATEQSHNVAILQSKGILDAAAYSVKLRDLEAKLAELRRERRRLLKNEDLEEVMEAVRQTAEIVHSAPERLDDFDEALFDDLVEKMIVESQTCIRFRLYGGIELAGQIQEVDR